MIEQEDYSPVNTIVNARHEEGEAKAGSCR